MVGYGSCLGWDGAYGGWMTGGWLGLILVIALAAVVVVGIGLAMRSSGRSRDPAEILRRRFARGEISAEELDQARRTLGA